MSSFYSSSERVSETQILESEQGQLLCCHCPTALAVWVLWGDRGATKVVSHCCIDRYSNYNLPHSVPISIKHQQALKVSLYACQMEQKQHSMALALKKRHWPLLGVRHQIVSWIHWLENLVWLLIYGFREGCHITPWIILIWAQVHLETLNLCVTGSRSL